MKTSNPPMPPPAPVPFDDSTPLLAPLFSDGRPLLTLGALGLLLAGLFGCFLAASGNFLPHDVAFLGMTPQQLCAQNACRIVHFMIHDRVSFGGTLIALATLHLWLIHFPLRTKEPWAWWTLCLSNTLGFASFLTYLGFGYLDTWHGLATLALLPCYALGLTLTYRTLPHPRSLKTLFSNAQGTRSLGSLLSQFPPDRASAGRLLLLATAATMFAAGLTITCVGITHVFVPQDLEYMSTTTQQLNALNPRLIPLIAHDRAGFGAGVLNTALCICAATWHAPAQPPRHLHQALALAGFVGFTTAIGVHPLVGYNNPVHLAPACLGAIAYTTALLLTRPRNHARGRQA